jgi:hypothetical protein
LIYQNESNEEITSFDKWKRDERPITLRIEDIPPDPHVYDRVLNYNSSTESDESESESRSLHSLLKSHTILVWNVPGFSQETLSGTLSIKCSYTVAKDLLFFDDIKTENLCPSGDLNGLGQEVNGFERRRKLEEGEVNEEKLNEEKLNKAAGFQGPSFLGEIKSSSPGEFFRRRLGIGSITRNEPDFANSARRLDHGPLPGLLPGDGLLTSGKAATTNKMAIGGLQIPEDTVRPLNPGSNSHENRPLATSRIKSNHPRHRAPVCSRHGECQDDGTCHCDGGYIGEACENERDDVIMTKGDFKFSLWSGKYRYMRVRVPGEVITIMIH